MRAPRPDRGATAKATETAAFANVRLPAARVTLRTLTAADVPTLFGFFSDPEVTRYWSRPPMTHLARARTLVRDIRAGYRSGDSLQLGVERNSDEILIGTCTLFHFYPNCRRAEIGYALGSTYWGQGFMHEALQTLLTFAFEDLSLHRLEADIDPRNAASARSLERLGFVWEGHLRERWIVADVISDSDVYGLLRREWRQPEDL
jgi:RimJ/RimL family protein N-acetyltransferase